jgi:hypothetical protein
MAKFLLVGRKLINMENIDYVDLGDEEKSTVTVYFGGAGDSSRSIQFTGDEANELWERLEEETTLGTSEPRP